MDDLSIPEGVYGRPVVYTRYDCGSCGFHVDTIASSDDKDAQIAALKAHVERSDAEIVRLRRCLQRIAAAAIGMAFR